MLKMDRTVIENEKRSKIWDLQQQIDRTETKVIELELQEQTAMDRLK
jgi:hypothetical protein